MNRPGCRELSEKLVRLVQSTAEASSSRIDNHALRQPLMTHINRQRSRGIFSAQQHSAPHRHKLHANAVTAFSIAGLSKVDGKVRPCGSFKREFSSTTSCSSVSRFSYHIAASYSGKGQKLNPARNTFKFDPSSRFQPLPILKMDTKGKKKLRASGQDSFFASCIGNTGAVTFGVADGVGGWADQGIDSAEFSHGLCKYIADAAYEHSNQEEEFILSAKELLGQGFERVCHDDKITGGGSTACVAIARPDGTLDVANLGDSGFIQIRLNAVHHYSNPQTHAFNTPYQLSRVPPKILAQIAHFGGSIPFGDMPKDASVTSHQLRHGDILIFATDGVWDNLSPQDTLGITSRKMTDSGGWSNTDQGTIISNSLLDLTVESPENNVNSIQAALAIAITGDAKAASLNNKVDGPFAKAVQKQYPGEDFRGGKPDDICVVVALVCEST